MAADLHMLVAAADAGARLDAFLGAQPSCPSRSACAHLIEGARLRSTARPASLKSMPSRRAIGSRSSCPTPWSLVSSFHRISRSTSANEDDYLIVLSKQRGLVCHPAHGHADGTLANALVYHCGLEHLGTVQGEDRPGIVHRLDRDTSGLMLAAKDDDTQRALQDLIRLRTLDRRYITLVHGYVAMDEGRIDTRYRPVYARSAEDGRLGRPLCPAGHHHLPRARAL